MIDLRFVAPDLRRLDETDAEIVACGVFQDERPFRGLAGLLDFRLGGKLSRLAKQGFVVGALDEAVLLPVRPRLPADKLLVLGLGPRGVFDQDTFRRVLARTLDALAGLSVKRAVVELPGRGAPALDAGTSASILFETLGEDHRDALTFVEPERERAVYEQRDADTRRAARRESLRP
jgi:hypothetical protein